METIRTAAQEQLRRLLKLFPVDAVRAYWPEAESRKQEGLVIEATASLDHPLIARFVRGEMGRTKQHVYFYERPKTSGALPLVLPQESYLGTEIIGNCTIQFYCMFYEYEVILLGEKNRLDTNLSFLWPIAVEYRPGSIVVRFVKMAKDPSAYFPGMRVITTGTSIDERTVLGRIGSVLGKDFRALDIHNAIVKLIDDGTLDSPKAAWLGEGSTDSTAMHEDGLLRRDKPEVWESVKMTEMLNTVLRPTSDSVRLRHLRVMPGKGILDFPVYSDDSAHTRDLIDMILENN